MTVLSWNEIKDRALKFTKEWEGEKRERAEKDSFWNDFFSVFGMPRRRVATFEEPVKKLSGNQGFIDFFQYCKYTIAFGQNGTLDEIATSQSAKRLYCSSQ